jgi:hypothetical protein
MSERSFEAGQRCDRQNRKPLSGPKREFLGFQGFLATYYTFCGPRRPI